METNSHNKGVSLCNFNKFLKFDPQIFRLWLKILLVSKLFERKKF